MKNFVINTIRPIFTIIAGSALFLTGCSKNEPQQVIPSTKPVSEKTNTTKQNSFKPLDMVWIPRGTFNMGSKHGKPDELPVHKVTVDGFWINKTEVTNN